MGFSLSVEPRYVHLLEVAWEVEFGGLIGCVVWGYFHFCVVGEEDDGLLGETGE